MRSRTLSTLPGRCQRCWIRQEFCLCSELQPVANRTEIVLLRHEREAYKSTGTARIASLALARCQVIDFGEESAKADQALSALTAGACVLFPSEDAALTPPDMKRLIVLDGTWRQTRKMTKKLPCLAGVPKWKLPDKLASPLRLRESPDAFARSTLEAIADALAEIEGDSVAEPLRSLHALMVERVLKARGVWEQKRRAFPGLD
ncbi:MAG: DTW domain-containing protein [Myxococcaceae bacterium]|nr:DTW domain-containing protein [Myxococcaceae bacterium]